MRYRDSDPSDEEAVRLVLAGERKAFAPLVRRYYGSVLRLSQNILGSKAEAEDVSQEAALQAFLNLGNLRKPRQFGAWLHSIAANLARSALRRRRLLSLDSPGGEPSMSLVDESPTPEEVRLARELHDTVLEALNPLSEINREAVVGYYLEGHSYAELAELLNVPVSTVKGRLYKGRRQLEPTLAPVAREIFSRERRRKEVVMNGQDTVEVAVDDVIRVGSGDEHWREFPEIAKSLSEPYDPSRHGTPRGGAAVVMLREADGERVLPIYVGLGEGFSIWLSITGGQTMRPMTHDLMRELLETVGLQVESVAVNRLAESTFYAEISLSQSEQSYRVDARPSDAIALAVRLGAPVHVARTVFEEAALASRQAWPDWHRENFGMEEKD